ncbi:MAG: hypothetical protein A2W00_10190 [Candidatus Eisenbacteria bacterium RBG_16_71_46]|nr:MAG: hypothetical protein A2W00_10190 [Candidatus Eisenbacteria bacterium RBG_16_71_46]
MPSPQEFIDAIKAGDADRVKAMLDLAPGLVGARDASGLSAALTAAYHRQGAIADLIVSHGAKLDIFEAAALGQIDAVREHLKSDESLVNAYAPDGFFPLALAAFFGHAAVVELLLAHRADVRAVAKNPMRVTALHAATSNGHPGIVALLLVGGADPDAEQQQGWRALHAAAAAGRGDIAKLLLAHGADPAATTDEGFTPVQLARQKGHEEVAALLAARAG